jgi:hypothetical protein
MSSDKQIRANKQNAERSTGPVTPEGKAKSSLNAVRTGLTGRTVLLPTEDAALYETHCMCARRKWNPEGEDEIELTQSIADTEWRLRRIPSLEAGIFALGRIDFADKFAAIEDQRIVSELLNAQTYIAHHKQLANLSIQEGRLRRNLEKDVAALKLLQQQRHDRREQALSTAAALFIAAQREKKPFPFEQFGFEFSEEDLEHRLDFIEARRTRSQYDEIIAERRSASLWVPKAA